MGRKTFDIGSFKKTHYLKLRPGDLIYEAFFASREVAGPYRVSRVVNDLAKRQSFVEVVIVGLESAGKFTKAAGFYLIPSFRPEHAERYEHRPDAKR